MRYWIVPSNDNTFRIGDAIKAQEGKADWRTDKFSVGDVVFIYKTKPEQCIRYKMEVVKTNISFDQAFNQENFWTDLETYYNGITFVCARLQLLEEYTDDRLSLAKLREHGVKGNIQSVQSCPEDSIGFLLNPIEDEQTEITDIENPDDNEDFFEGTEKQVTTNKYERNRAARKKCIELKGLKCLVCGRNFEETYGEIGKGFIHVHHLVPISSIGKEYQINVEQDLAPVCPNCHYMLHRKEPPYTIEELQRMMKETEEDIAESRDSLI